MAKHSSANLLSTCCILALAAAVHAGRPIKHDKNIPAAKVVAGSRLESGAAAQEGRFGPDSYMYWAPNRQLLATESSQRRGAGGGGRFGPDSYMYWAPNRQLLATESSQRRGAGGGGRFGPDSYMYWAPNRQLLNEPSGDGMLGIGHAGAIDEGMVDVDGATSDSDY